MIIVKTNNGDRFINEAETLQINHIRDNALVEVWPSRCGNQQQQPQYYIIEHVESVIYTTQETKWKDEGSEIQRLKAELEKKEKELSKGYDHFAYIREWFFIYQNAFDDIKNAVLRSKNGSKCEDSVIDALIDAAEKKHKESEEKFEAARKKWEE
jgi:signal recognition particle GTPase